MFGEAYDDKEAWALLRESGILISLGGFSAEIMNLSNVEHARNTIKLVMQKMLDPEVDWNDTVFCTDDMLSNTLFERLAETYVDLGGKDLCDCGGAGCKDCNHTGFNPKE